MGYLVRATGNAVKVNLDFGLGRFAAGLGIAQPVQLLSGLGLLFIVDTTIGWVLFLLNQRDAVNLHEALPQRSASGLGQSGEKQQLLAVRRPNRVDLAEEQVIVADRVLRPSGGCYDVDMGPQIAIELGKRHPFAIGRKPGALNIASLAGSDGCGLVR